MLRLAPRALAAAFAAASCIVVAIACDGPPQPARVPSSSASASNDPGDPGDASVSGTDGVAASDSISAVASASAQPPDDPRLQKTDLVVGTGDEARTGAAVTVHYVGTLQSTGRKFDSSRDRGEPFSFILGNGQVIKGWERGVVGMRVGGKRRLVIAPELAYGAQGQPPTIPPNATLVFEIELLHVTL